MPCSLIVSTPIYRKEVDGYPAMVGNWLPTSLRLSGTSRRPNEDRFLIVIKWSETNRQPVADGF